jgi:hypothetical protein
MYKVLYNGEEVEFEQYEDAQNFVKNLGVEWTILNPDGSVAFDWMDKVGP